MQKWQVSYNTVSVGIIILQKNKENRIKLIFNAIFFKGKNTCYPQKLRIAIRTIEIKYYFHTILLQSNCENYP